LNAEKHQMELTFRSGARAPTSSKLSLSDFSVGQKVEGKVKKVADYGLFIQINDSNLSGLCHKSQAS
jgi:rRNA biogenesis protein RRP5